MWSENHDDFKDERKIIRTSNCRFVRVIKFNSVQKFVKIESWLLWSFWHALRKKCPYSELFWSVFSRIWIRITPNTNTYHAVLFTQSTNLSVKFYKFHCHICRSTDVWVFVFLGPWLSPLISSSKEMVIFFVFIIKSVVESILDKAAMLRWS